VSLRSGQHVNSLYCDVRTLLLQEGRDQTVAAANIQHANSGWKKFCEPVGQDLNSAARYQVVVKDSNAGAQSIGFCVGRQFNSLSSRVGSNSRTPLRFCYALFG